MRIMLTATALVVPGFLRLREVKPLAERTAAQAVGEHPAAA